MLWLEVRSASPMDMSDLLGAESAGRVVQLLTTTAIEHRGRVHRRRCTTAAPLVNKHDVHAILGEEQRRQLTAEPRRDQIAVLQRFSTRALAVVGESAKKCHADGGGLRCPLTRCVVSHQAHFDRHHSIDIGVDIGGSAAFLRVKIHATVARQKHSVTFSRQHRQRVRVSLSEAISS